MCSPVEAVEREWAIKSGQLCTAYTQFTIHCLLQLWCGLPAEKVAPFPVPLSSRDWALTEATDNATQAQPLRPARLASVLDRQYLSTLRYENGSVCGDPQAPFEQYGIAPIAAVVCGVEATLSQL